MLILSNYTLIMYVIMQLCPPKIMHYAMESEERDQVYVQFNIEGAVTNLKCRSTLQWHYSST